MAFVQRRNLGPIYHFLPAEPGLRAHVFRVAALAARAADRQGFPEANVETVESAGLLHHHALDLDGGPVVAKLLKDLHLPLRPGMDPLPRPVWEVLRVYRGMDKTADAFVAHAAALIESANLFDEQLENLPYADASAGEAVEELLCSGMVDPAFAEAVASFRVLSWDALLECARRLPAAAAKPEFERLFLNHGAEKLWRHSVDTAEQAVRVAAEAGGLDTEQAYLAGLVHDVGRLAYDISFAAPVLRQWQDAGFPATYAEFLVSGTDHAALGAEILKMWGFPTELVEAVENHHRPEVTRSRLTAALYATEDPDESLPSCARDHAAAKRLDIEAVRKSGSAG